MLELARTYGTLIRRVSRQVAHQSNARYGFNIVDPDDLAQEVFIKLVEESVNLSAVGEPQAWVRSTARLKAVHAIEGIIRPGREDGRHGARTPGRVTPTDLTTRTENGYSIANDARFSSEVGIPEQSFEFEETVTELKTVIDRIVAKVFDLDQREAIKAYYLRGEEKTTSAERKRRSRAHAQLSPEEVASLQVWRAWLFPEAKLPRTHGQHPASPLIEVLS